MSGRVRPRVDGGLPTSRARPSGCRLARVGRAGPPTSSPSSAPARPG
ncbi:MAG: hypothetical protein MZW92_56205 [Comamonadaceae bacterium]|nr:hypothetical protein [Comamonadaceae bacterium]